MAPSNELLIVREGFCCVSRSECGAHIGIHLAERVRRRSDPPVRRLESPS
jgi:hypothetical protein